MSDRVMFECDRCQITILMPGPAPGEDDDGWSPKCLGCYVRMRRAPPVSAFAINVGRELAAAIPVLEAAIQGAIHHAGPSGPGSLRDAVRGFGGGGPDGIELAEGRLVEWRALAWMWGQLLAMLRPLAEPGPAPRWNEAREYRRRLRAVRALEWFVGMSDTPPQLPLQGDE